VGNAVSTFSALLIMERAHSGKFAAYYNGGMIPLKQFVPLYQVRACMRQLPPGVHVLLTRASAYLNAPPQMCRCCKLG